MAAPKRSFLHDDGRGSNDGCWQTAVIERSDEDAQAQGGGARTWTWTCHAHGRRTQRISADLVSAARPGWGWVETAPRERRASRGRGAPVRARPKRAHACGYRPRTRQTRDPHTATYVRLYVTRDRAAAPRPGPRRARRRAASARRAPTRSPRPVVAHLYNCYSIRFC
jgi:hypothetical protein